VSGDHNTAPAVMQFKFIGKHCCLGDRWLPGVALVS